MERGVGKKYGLKELDKLVEGSLNKKGFQWWNDLVQICEIEGVHKFFKIKDVCSL